MSTWEPDETIPIREIERNAGRVFERVQQGYSFVVTDRYGVPLARIIPVDVERRDEVGIPREESPSGTRLGSEAIMDLRERRDKL